MGNQEAILTEYDTLRQELIQAIQLNLQAAAVTLPVAGGVIAYGFQIKSSAAFLAAIVVLQSALWYSAYSLAKIRLMGAYIRAIIEPKIEGLQWETMQAVRRKKERLEGGRTASQATIAIYALVCLICLIFAWMFLQDHSSLSLGIYSGITVILLVSLSIGSIRVIIIVSERYYENRAMQWIEIEEELNQKIIQQQEKAE